MKKYKLYSIAALAMGGLLTTSPVMAQSIIGSPKITASANTTLGNGTGRFPLSQMTDGVTSDASPYNGYQARERQTGVISLTLDQAYDLTQFYLWNDINVRAEGVKKYRLRFYDANNNPIGTDITGLTTNNGQVAPHVTNFSRAGVKKVDLFIDSVNTANGLRRVEIREVAFEGAPAKAAATAYRCYDLMRDSAKLQNKQFTMVDQFGQTQTVIGHPVQLCNPVALNQRGATPESMTKIYKDHLVCYELFDVRGNSPRQNVQVKNQLESNQLLTTHADQVCLVSTKRHIKNAPERGRGRVRQRRQ